jgi:hypothetical protein
MIERAWSIAMTNRWTLVLILSVIAGAFVSWFAPLELITCETEFGVQECYITEDEFETSVVRVASAAGALVAMGAGFVLLALWTFTRTRHGREEAQPDA